MSGGDGWRDMRNWPGAKRVSPQTDETPPAVFLYPVVQVEGVIGQSSFTGVPSRISKTLLKDIDYAVYSLTVTDLWLLF